MSPSVIVKSAPHDLVIEAARSAVIVVDMQNDFGSPGGFFDLGGVDISGIEAVVPRIADVLLAARQAGMKIVYLKMGFRPDLSDAGAPDSPNWLKHAQLKAIGEEVTAPDGRPSRVLIRDTWNTDIVPALVPQESDAVVYKSRFSGFYGTDLDRILKSHSISTLIFTGCTTSICVESTIRDAMYRDYTCLLLADCAAEPIGDGLSRSNHEASLLAVQALLGWVSNSGELLDALVLAESQDRSASHAMRMS